MRELRIKWMLLLALLFQPSAFAASSVAYDKGNQKFGYCHHKASADEAKQCAMAKCSMAGGKNCQIAETGQQGGHSAIAVGKGGAIGTWLSSYEANEIVERDALSRCAVAVNGDCDPNGDGAEFQRCLAGTGCKVVARWDEPIVAMKPQVKQQAQAGASTQEQNAQSILTNSGLLPLTSEQAAQREGQTVTMQFLVKSVGWNQTGYDELYSESTWQDPNAFLIRIPFSMRSQFNLPIKDYFGGQVVRVTGTVQTLDFGTMKRKVIYINSTNQIAKVAGNPQILGVLPTATASVTAGKSTIKPRERETNTGERDQVYCQNALLRIVSPETLSEPKCNALLNQTTKAWNFVAGYMGWTNAASMQAPLTLRVASDGRIKIDYPNLYPILGVALSPSLFVTTLRVLDDPFANGTLAHELAHVQSMRVLTELRGVPTYFVEGHGLRLGRAFRDHLKIPNHEYDYGIASIISRYSPDEAGRVFGAGNIRATMQIESLGIYFIEYIRTRFHGGMPDAAHRMGKVFESMARGNTYEAAFQEQYGVPVSEVTSEIIALFERSRANPGERLRGTLYEEFIPRLVAMQR